MNTLEAQRAHYADVKQRIAAAAAARNIHDPEAILRTQQLDRKEREYDPIVAPKGANTTPHRLVVPKVDPKDRTKPIGRPVHLRSVGVSENAMDRMAHEYPALGRLLDKLCKDYDTDPLTVFRGSPSGADITVRRMLSWYAIRVLKLQLTYMGVVLGKDHSTIRSMVVKVDNLIAAGEAQPVEAPPRQFVTEVTKLEGEMV